ncbi:ribosome hibernation-promoting factor, HPF/YfiA family [Clostridium gasigenes]|uniref:Ribosome hibernation promoting factor n=1 Tax=Clostridium gasigenes TaxID=94869 RepID=A0A1H0RWM5_9CLOT|nr:ribosome-associated translation inhibitor RaiA [Clostridium gasigenes]SDP33807.1 putative sigma-54 modulation protein [Clostridium gasigenes]
MRISIIGKNIELTPALKEMVEKKISKLDKYFEPHVEARAKLTVQKNRHIFEVTIPFNGVILRGEEATDDMYKSIDIVEEKLERQIRKQKTKLARRSMESLKFPYIDEVAVGDDDANEKEPSIVRMKKFCANAMSSEEAILQMELLGHSFFIYEDIDEASICVIYKRKDGNYGLLEPQYS